MVNVRQILKPEGTNNGCSVPKCEIDSIGAVVFLNIAFEYVTLNTCGDHTQLLQAAQNGVVDVIRWRSKTFEEEVEGMSKEEIKTYKASLK